MVVRAYAVQLECGLQVFEPVVYDGFDAKDLLLHAALSTQVVHHDAIDAAVRSFYPDQKHLEDDFEVIHFVPFDPVSKRTIALVREKETNRVFRCLKGAPQVCTVECE